MKNLFNFYMEHSKSFMLLHTYLAIQELLNTPIKAVLLLIPVGMYAFGLSMRGYIEITLLPVSYREMLGFCYSVLLIVMLLTFELAIMVSIGRALHNKETAVIKEALRGTNENLEMIFLVYKRKNSNQIKRKIYSHIPKAVWDDKSVYLRVLQLFDEHFFSDRFITDKQNSRIVIMNTRQGFIRPIKEEFHDEQLDSDMDGIT